MKKYIFTIMMIFWNFFIALFMILIFYKNIGESKTLDYIKSNYDIFFFLTFVPFLLFYLLKIISNFISDDIESGTLINEILVTFSSLIIPITLYFLENNFYALPSKFFGNGVPLIILILAIWLPYIIVNIYSIYYKKKNKGFIKQYTVRAALSEDISSPYIWLTNNPYSSNEIVKITNIKNNKSIWCEVIKTSKNFINKYNENNRTKNISINEPYMIINNWYRNKLGLDKNKVYQIKLDISNKPSFIKQIFSAYIHPDNAVRLSTLIAIISLFLGFIGTILGCVSLL